MLEIYNELVDVLDSPKCVWSKTEGTVRDWNSFCGKQFNDAPIECWFNFCPFCGKRVEQRSK